MLAVVKIMAIVTVFPMITMMGVPEKKVEIVHILCLMFIK
jgi:hypothetical protein